MRLHIIFAFTGGVWGGGRDIFEHKKSAYLVDPYDIEEIANGFLYLADRANRERVLQNTDGILDRYTCDKVWRQYFEVYKKALVS